MITGHAGRNPMAFRICPVSAHQTATSRQDNYAICQSLRNKREARPAGSQQAQEVPVSTTKNLCGISKRKMHRETHYTH